MTFQEHAGEAKARAEAERATASRDALEQEAVRLRARLKLSEKELERLRSQVDFIERASATRPTIPRWAQPGRGKGGHRGTACLLLTDAHFDENVSPAEIDDVNAYSRPIGELRLRRCIDRTIVVARDYMSGVKHDGMMLFLGGDIFSGNIHEELRITNADTLFGSLLHWLGPMAAGITSLADHFGAVHVAGVPGNHGRMTRKPIAKQRAADNLDWLFYSLLARELKHDKRITWAIGASADALVTVYNTRFLLTHGDQFRGGSGIAGALSPLMLGTHRKTRRQMAAGRPYDIMVMGHWHQMIHLPSKGLIVGGSLKGYDEYSAVSNFEPEAPQQAFWITTPEYGITFHAPIFVADRRAEGW